MHTSSQSESYTRLTQINLANIEKSWLCVILIYCFGSLGQKNTGNRNMIYFCVAPFAILAAPTHSIKCEPCIITQARMHTGRRRHALFINQKETCENFREVRFGIGFRLYTFLFGKLRSCINLRELFSPEARRAAPIWERSFALFDIHRASHNPTCALQPPLKSTRITYDTISCNNEATKDTGI